MNGEDNETTRLLARAEKAEESVRRLRELLRECKKSVGQYSDKPDLWERIMKELHESEET